jgi:hypothetical protein
VYAAAAAVAILDPRSAAQAFHLGHTSAVAALALSPCGTYGASGDSPLRPGCISTHNTHVDDVQQQQQQLELGQQLLLLPCVRVWDAGSGALLVGFPPCVTEGVAGLYCVVLCVYACCVIDAASSSN